MEEFCEYILIYNINDKFIIKKGAKIFYLFKESLELVETLDDFKGNYEKIYNIAGIVNSESNSYLLCVSKVEIIGNLFNSLIYKVNEVIFI
jgi:hypothetical protein